MPVPDECFGLINILARIEDADEQVEVSEVVRVRVRFGLLVVGASRLWSSIMSDIAGSLNEFALALSCDAKLHPKELRKDSFVLPISSCMASITRGSVPARVGVGLGRVDFF